MYNLLKYITINFLLSYWVWSPLIEAAENRAQLPPVFVETTTIKLAAKPGQIASIGTLIALPGITVKPEISGRVTNIWFKSGEVVNAGAALIEIGSDIIKAELAAAEAQLKCDQLNFERSLVLYKTRDIAKSDLDLVQAKYNSAKARAAGIQAKLRQAMIVAPFAGKLGLSQVSVGDYINAGQNIVSLQTVDPLKVDFSVPEVYQSKVAVGQTVLLHTDAYAQEVFHGTVEAVEALINPHNRTLNVRANVANKEGKLIPGGFVTVTLQFAAHQLITIPQTAVVYDPHGSYVFKAVNGKAEKTKVVLGAKDEADVVVQSGLKPGDTVVTVGQIKVYPGAPLIAVGKKPA